MKTKNTTYEQIVRGRWIYDGCKNLEEMIVRLKLQIEKLEDFRSHGIILGDEVQDDYAFLITSDKKTAEKFDFHLDNQD